MLNACWRWTRFLAPIVGFAFWACTAPPVENPKVVVIQETDVHVPQNTKNKVDILFLVDNSSSMEQMSAELRARFPDFFKPFSDAAKAGIYADLHIGVITSDMGAGATGVPGGGCDVAPGDKPWEGGRLIQKGPCADENDAVCSRNRMPLPGLFPGCSGPTTHNWVEYKFDSTGGTGNLPGTQSLVDTFTCMASVGANGCGFEHQLEAVYAALKGPPSQDPMLNQGFLRDDATLAVVWLTNEDDGSASPDAKMWDPGGAVNTVGALTTYRQTRFGLVCGNPQKPPPFPPIDMNQAKETNLMNCVPATNPSNDPLVEYDISRYVNLFTQLPAMGGLKADPKSIILVGIDADDQGGNIKVVLTDSLRDQSPPPGLPYNECSPINLQPTNGGKACLVALQHSCVNTVQPGFFGDPAVRLNTVIRQVAKQNGQTSPPQISSICGADVSKAPDYTQAMQQVANSILVNIGNGCIVSKLPDVMHPDCSVNDITLNNNGTSSSKVLPQCTGSNFPCWKVEAKTACSMPGPDGKPLSPDGVGLTVDRGGAETPPNTNAQVSCATVAM